MINNSENQGWFHFSRNTLTPTLEARNSVLHGIRSKNNTPSPRTLRHLKTLQHKVDEAVSVAKTRWSCHLAEETHNMPFNPKEAWVSIGRLTGGESSHHPSLKVIQMRLPSGNLAENEEENVSVFANHFKKVLKNHKPTDITVINEIHLREVMEELDDPPLVEILHLCHTGIDQQQINRSQRRSPKCLQVHVRGKSTPPLQLHHRFQGG